MSRFLTHWSESSRKRAARIFEQAHDSYAALVADPEAYAEWRAEFESWDVTIADGLEPE